MDTDQTPIALDTILIALLEQGVEPTTLSRALSLDLHYVNSLPATRTQRIAGEEEIANSVLRLMTMAIDEGKKILIEGTPAVKMRFIHSMLSIYVKNFSTQAPKELEELRGEFMELLTSQAVPNAP